MTIAITKPADKYTFAITNGTPPYTINVFSKSGSPVYEKSYDTAPFEWDGKTTDGNKLAEGMYTFVLKDKTGKAKDGVIYLVADK